MSMHSICNDAIELNRHVQAGQRSSVTDKTIDRIEERWAPAVEISPMPAIPMTRSCSMQRSTELLFARR